MPFFFIVPIWALCVVLGVTLMFFRDLWNLARFVIALLTGATLVSFALSTAVLYFVPRFAHEPHPKWYGLALIVAYIIALLLGALIGAIGALLLLLKLPMSKRA